MNKLITLLAATALTSLSWSQCNVSYTYTTTGNTANFTSSVGNGFGGAFYYWDFGDGGTDFTPNPSHTYNSSGWYLACLTVYDSLGQCGTVTYCDTIVIQGTGGCNASYTMTDSAGYTFFTNTSTGSNLSYYWDFGDGNSSTAQDPVHQYANSGWYWLCLTVYNNTGCQDTQCDSVYVNAGSGGGGCNASFVYGDSAGYTYFSSTSTGTNLNYSWDFGDGSFGTGTNPVHQYATGWYLACLTIWDNAGCQDTQCDSIYVPGGSGGGCTANFGLLDSAGYMHGYNMTTGAAYVEWFVYDPSYNLVHNSIGTDFAYMPQSAGNYTVCLYAYDNNQQWCDSTCQNFTVTSISDYMQESVQFNMYPNPADDQITIQLNQADDNNTIIITDAVGRIVYKSNLVGSLSKVVQVSGFESGIYNVTIQSDTRRSITKRFVKH